MKKRDLLSKLEAMPNCLFTKDQVIEMLSEVEPEVVVNELSRGEIVQAVTPHLLFNKANYIDLDKMDFTIDLDRRICVLGIDWLDVEYIVEHILNTLRSFDEKAEVVDESVSETTTEFKGVQETTDVIESSKGVQVTEPEVLDVQDDNQMPEHQYKGVQFDNSDVDHDPRLNDHLFPYDPEANN
jgi:hypothetical protein